MAVGWTAFETGDHAYRGIRGRMRNICKDGGRFCILVDGLLGDFGFRMLKGERVISVKYLMSFVWGVSVDFRRGLVMGFMPCLI